MKTFEPNKTTKELGIDLTRKFIVVEKSKWSPHIGDILEIREDDNSSDPLFWNLTRDSNSVGEKHETEYKWKCVACWSQLAYYDEPKTATEMQNKIATEARIEQYKREGTFFVIEPGTDKEEIVVPKEYFNFHYNINNTQTSQSKTTTKGNKIMSNIVSFFNDLTVSAEDKELRKAGLKDGELNWTEDARAIILNLEAKERGYKSFTDLDSKFAFYTDTELSVFEYEALFTKFYSKLLETSKKFNKREEKK